MRRAALIAATGLLGGFALYEYAISALSGWGGMWGIDYRLYMDATSRWLSGGPFYEPWQLAPYAIAHHRPILYPPVAIVLFAPFTVLPAVLWWAVPLSVLVGVTLYHRPALWAWLLVAGCLAIPQTVMTVVVGNPGIWTAAAVALATLWRPAAVLVLVKPTLLPFALLGANRRAWWIALGLFALACLPFAALWWDWLRVVRNITDATPLYSLTDVPLVLVPLVAWFSRPTRRTFALRLPWGWMTDRRRSLRPGRSVPSGPWD